MIDEGRLFQRGGSLLEHGCLFGGVPLNLFAVMRFEPRESFMERLDVEHCDGERTNTTMGTAGPTWDRSEQGGFSPLKPAVGLALESR
ncbi:protein of unknown function [Nitrospira japonica]|uniref:Uncharacterized protein n=1 Tax=Nitrospira japonica TaxID=1325564 RepID=A0A1W1I1A0_9BACT|nr:protein of unknown function [Nitrospira japonica]